MNLLGRLTTVVRKAVGSLSPVYSGGGWWPVVHESFAGAWQRNIEVSREDMLGSPIVYSCMTLIANDIGTLRARLVERNEKGIWKEVERNAPFWPVLRKPNRYQNHIQFKQWWVMSKLRTGNTYALKERDMRGIVVRLHVLDASRCTPMVADDGSVWYQLGQDSLTGVREPMVIVPADEIIHDRMNCLYHPLVGISPLHAAAIAAGVGINIQKNTAQFFGNRSTPSGILVAPGNISPDNAKALKEAWDANYSGANAGKVAVLADGLKFEPMSQKATDSQLIETLRWSDERVCSVFHVPAYKVGVGTAPNLNSTEMLERGYYNNCLRTLVEEMEAALDEGLGHDGISIGVDLDTDGLLRMDGKTMMETLRAGVDGSILTINDARRRVNEPELDGGDTVYMQQQDMPLHVVRNNKLPTPAAPPTPAPEPADMSDEDKSMIAEARAIVATQKAIDAMRHAALSETVNA